MLESSREDFKLVKVKKAESGEKPLNLGDYLTTESRERHTKAQQLTEARRNFLRNNR